MDDSCAGDRSVCHIAPCGAARDFTVGVVVTCHAPERLPDVLRLLDSIRRQTSAIDAVAVVVQRSREVLESVHRAVAQWSCPNVKVVFQEADSGVSRARNAGVEELTSDIIAFVDDDSVLADDWAEATRLFYSSRPDAIGVAGAILPLWDTTAMEWFPRELYWMLSCTYWMGTCPTPVRNGYGANMSFRREAFDGGRYFSESIGISGWGSGGWRGMGGEEPELALRVTSRDRASDSIRARCACVAPDKAASPRMEEPLAPRLLGGEVQSLALARTEKSR